MTFVVPEEFFVDSFGLSLYFTIIGYYFLVAVVFFMRFVHSDPKKPYWAWFSLFFLFLAGSRALFIVHDYYIAPSPAQLIWWRLATICAWLAVSMLAGILSILLVTGKDKKAKILRTVIPLLPVIAAVVVAILPDVYVAEPEQLADPSTMVGAPLAMLADYPVGRFYLNVVFLPLITILIPICFFYLGFRSIGVIRRSSYLNGLGFLIYYLGRSLQSVLEPLGYSEMTQAITPPLVILLGVLFIALANQYEQLK